MLTDRKTRMHEDDCRTRSIAHIGHDHRYGFAVVRQCRFTDRNLGIPETPAEGKVSRMLVSIELPLAVEQIVGRRVSILVEIGQVVVQRDGQ